MLWVDVKEMVYIDDECDIVAIRPFIKFLIKDKIYGFEPFKNFRNVLDCGHKFGASATYQRACLNAYFQGNMNCVSLVINMVWKFSSLHTCIVAYFDLSDRFFSIC